MNNDFDAIVNKHKIISPEDIDELLIQNDALAKDLIGTLDACLAHEPQRKDIMQEYIPLYHERICKSLSQFYETNYKLIQNLDLIQLINWVMKYKESLLPYGLNDDRLINGVHTLSTIYSKRLFKTNIKMIMGLLKQTRDELPITNEEGKKMTNTILDLYKIITETFETLSRCKHKEVAMKLVKISKEEIWFYETNLETMIETLDFTVDQLIAFCNSIFTFIRLTNDFFETMKLLTDIEEDILEQEFDKSEILRKFTEISDKAKEKLMEEIFKNLNVYFKVTFMDLNMEMVLTTVFENIAPVISALHDNFSRKIWKHCLDNIILLYTQSLMNSANKIKTKQLSLLLNKLTDDLDLFQGAFKDVLGNTAIDSSKKVINEIKDFLDSSPDLISVSVLQLRKSHGQGFNLNTIKMLLNLRSDITSKDKAAILQSCKEILANYKSEETTDQKGFKQFFQKIEVENEPEDDDDFDIEEEKEEEMISNPTQESKPEAIKKSEENKGPIKLGLKTLEGFLDKKSPNKMAGWQRRWFSIKNYKIYWYKNERSREAQNSMKIGDIIKCEPRKELKFKIHLEDRIHKLRAETTQERDKWVQVINELMEEYLIENNPTLSAKTTTEIFANITGESIFKDYEEDWIGPSQSEREALFNQPKVQRFIQKGHNNKHDKVNKDGDKDDPNRRRSLTLDDLISIESGKPLVLTRSRTSTAHVTTTTTTTGIENDNTVLKMERKSTYNKKISSVFEFSSSTDDDYYNTKKNYDQGSCFSIIGAIFKKK